MGEAELATCVLIALLFVIFIVWGRTSGGQKRLREIFGEPRRSPGSARATRGTARRSNPKQVATGDTQASTGRKTSGATASKSTPSARKTSTRKK